MGVAGAHTSITRPAELQVTLGYCGSPAKAPQLGELWQEMLRGANTDRVTRTLPAVACTLFTSAFTLAVQHSIVVWRRYGAVGCSLAHTHSAKVVMT
jgi:hypothetical protein